MSCAISLYGVTLEKKERINHSGNGRFVNPFVANLDLFLPISLILFRISTQLGY